MATKNKYPDIIFLGQPNSGKSALFNAIAGLKADTSNFPGSTVKHTHSEVNIAGKILNVIDLPGAYSLNPTGETEKVALSHLFFEKPDLIINVVDASVLARSLELTLELIELKFPVIVALNMMDLAEKKGIECRVFPWQAPRVRYFQDLMDFLEGKDIDLIVLAGFMRRLSANIIERYAHCILNIHPALLPSFPGEEAQKQAFDYGVKFSGCTVHFVDEGVDTGPIIQQRVVPVLDDDDAKTLAARILEQEHQLFPEVVRLFCNDQLEIVGRRVHIK